MRSFGFDPDLVSEVSASTSAGVDVVRKPAWWPALNLLDTSSYDELEEILIKTLM
ncbi:MAG: hypothetical protein ACPGLY_24305 [Rubripirellula sp.]